MYKKILIATDGSETAKRAALQAVALAKALGAEVLAVCVVDTRSAGGPSPFVPGAEAASYYLPLLEHLRGYAQGSVDEVVAEGDRLGVRVKPEIRDGIPASAILDAARSWGAELVVMGTEGRTGLKLLLLGSTAQAVLHRSPVPVLLVR